MEWGHLIPKTLVRRYRVVSELGRGAMGVVLEVERVEDGRRFAMKLLLDRDSGEDLRRFQREGRVLSDITHPHIVGVEEVTDHAIVMELIDGRSLAELLADGRRWNEAEALVILRQLLAGLQAVHAFGIVHRDVKPENIFIRSDGTAALGDFGIARVESEGTALTATGMALGTPNYMSPEQMEAGAVDGRADLFSLGLVVGELLGAGRPWDGEGLFSIIALQRRERWLIRDRLPDLSDESWKVLDGLTHIDADRRFESAKRVLDFLDGEAPQAGELREARSRSTSPPAVPPARSPAESVATSEPTGKVSESLSSPGSERTKLGRRILKVGVPAGTLVALSVFMLTSSPFVGSEIDAPSTAASASPPSSSETRPEATGAEEAPQFSRGEDPVGLQREEIGEMAGAVASHLERDEWDEALSSIGLPFSWSLWAPASESRLVDSAECRIEGDPASELSRVFWWCNLENHSSIRSALVDRASSFVEALQYVQAHSEMIRTTTTSAQFIMDPFVVSFDHEGGEWRLRRCCSGGWGEF